jgi:hypothetical protein
MAQVDSKDLSWNQAGAAPYSVTDLESGFETLRGQLHFIVYVWRFLDISSSATLILTPNSFWGESYLTFKGTGWNVLVLIEPVAPAHNSSSTLSRLRVRGTIPVICQPWNIA